MIDEDRKMTNSKNNIILIGMPGSGKSTNGVILAKNMGMDFIDSDILIQHVKGMRLEELLNIHGPEGFNVIEEEVNAAIDVENTVIATGGSVVYGEKAMENLKAQGTVVYLDITCKELEERLGDLRERGVSIKDGWTLPIIPIIFPSSIIFAQIPGCKSDISAFSKVYLLLNPK